MKSLSTILAFAACTAFAAVASAQPVGLTPAAKAKNSARYASHAAAVAAARAALKAGDSAAAVAAFAPGVSRTARGPHQDLQLAHELGGLAFQFQAEGDVASAKSAVALAAARIDQPEARMSRADAASAYALKGTLLDYVLGDAAAAKAAYRQALALDDSRTLAKERLAKLEAIEANAQLKEQGNALLRERAAQANSIGGR